MLQLLFIALLAAGAVGIVLGLVHTCSGPPRPPSSRTQRERWKAGLADDEFPDHE